MCNLKKDGNGFPQVVNHNNCIVLQLVKSMSKGWLSKTMDEKSTFSCKRYAIIVMMRCYVVSFVLGHLLPLVQGNYKLLKLHVSFMTKISFTNKNIIINLQISSSVCNLGMVRSLPIYIGMNIS